MAKKSPPPLPPPPPPPVEVLAAALESRPPDEPTQAILTALESETGEALARGLMAAMKDLGLAKISAKDGEAFPVGLDLRDRDEWLTTEASSLARRTYVASYIRLLEVLAQPAISPSHALEQAKLGLAYIRHAETTDKDMMRLGSRENDPALDQAITQLEQEITHIAVAKVRRETRLTTRHKPSAELIEAIRSDPTP